MSNFLSIYFPCHVTCESTLQSTLNRPNLNKCFPSSILNIPNCPIHGYWPRPAVVPPIIRSEPDIPQTSLILFQSVSLDENLIRNKLKIKNNSDFMLRTKLIGGRWETEGKFLRKLWGEQAALWLSYDFGEFVEWSWLGLIQSFLGDVKLDEDN